MEPDGAARASKAAALGKEDFSSYSAWEPYRRAGPAPEEEPEEAKRSPPSLLQVTWKLASSPRKSFHVLTRSFSPSLLLELLTAGLSALAPHLFPPLTHRSVRVKVPRRPPATRKPRRLQGQVIVTTMSSSVRGAPGGHISKATCHERKDQREYIQTWEKWTNSEKSKQGVGDGGEKGLSGGCFQGQVGAAAHDDHGPIQWDPLLGRRGRFH